MEWLSQNWTWIVLGVGVVWLLSRAHQGGSMGGCGHGMAHEGPQEPRKGADLPAATPKQAADQEAKKGMTSSHRHRGGCC